MRKTLVLQHVPYEPLGTLDPMLRAAGFRVRYVNFGREPEAKPSLRGYAGLIVLGGPMSADDTAQYPHLETEVRLLREALERDLAVLGICLGAQLLACAAGGRVARMTVPEIGWYPISVTGAGRADPVLGEFSPTEHIFQWHSDSFELPDGALHLARSPDCANQAFRIGERAYGFQFHLEADEALIARWLHVPAHARELERQRGRIDPDTIRRETPVHGPRSRALGRRTFAKFIELAGWRGRRRRRLRSR